MANRTFSGARVLRFNLRERAISDDFTRLQGFADAEFAEVWRRTALARALSKEAAGKAAVPSASGTPPQAIVLEGLRPRPEIGTTNFFVEPGAVAIAFPDASPHPDDCPARLIFDPGVTSAAQLVLTAGSGSTRIDVVECQPTQVVVESDNRDIFDPATGVSAPALVDKVTRGALAYRIRTGTPGGGFPGAVADWLPLAVCKVPSTATTWDDCDVWDVRPLLADLAEPPHVTTRNFPSAKRQIGSAISFGATDQRVRGIVEIELDGFKVGGELAVSTSGADYLQVGSSGTLRETGFAASASLPWYVYLLTPFDLPRWSKLTPATALERTPTEPRGIPVFTQKAPTGLSGRADAGSPISLPAATGLQGSTTRAVVVMAGAYVAGAAFSGCIVAGGWTRLHGNPGIVLTPSSGNNTSIPVYTLAGNVSYPACAVALRLRFAATIAGSAGDSFDVGRSVFLFDAPSGNSVSVDSSTVSITFDAGGHSVVKFECDVEIPPNLPSGDPQTLELNVTYTNVGTFTAETCSVVGWRLYD